MNVASTLHARGPLAGRHQEAVPRRAVAARFQASGGGAAQPASEPGATIVHFEVAQAVPYGQRVAVLGDAAELGAWEPERAVTLAWGDADVWTGQAKMCAWGGGVEMGGKAGNARRVPVWAGRPRTRGGPDRATAVVVHRPGSGCRVLF